MDNSSRVSHISTPSTTTSNLVSFLSELFHMTQVGEKVSSPPVVARKSIGFSWPSSLRPQGVHEHKLMNAWTVVIFKDTFLSTMLRMVCGYTTKAGLPRQPRGFPRNDGLSSTFVSCSASQPTPVPSNNVRYYKESAISSCFPYFISLNWE